MKRKALAVALALWVGLLCGCCDDDAEEGGGRDSQVIPSRPITDNQANTSDGDAAKSVTELSLCSVDIRIVFSGEKAVEIGFKNNNDTSAWVHVQNESTGGLVAKNCLWPKGEDFEPVSFSFGDALTIAVYLGKGDVLHFSCSEFFGELLDFFQLCGEQGVTIVPLT